MKKKTITMNITQYPNQIKNGQYRGIYNKNGKIADIQQRVGGKMVSIIEAVRDLDSIGGQIEVANLGWVGLNHDAITACTITMGKPFIKPGVSVSDEFKDMVKYTISNEGLVEVVNGEIDVVGTPEESTTVTVTAIIPDNSIIKGKEASIDITIVPAE